jgi:DNA invertase Pin-like site-specific DNA recombinase
MASRCNVVHKDQSGAQRQTSVNAVLYARVSSKDQEREGFSIPAQLQLLRGYAASRGLTVLKEFVDVETAKQAGRTGFGEMLAFLRKDKTCRILLVEKTDRLYRNLKDWVTLDELDLEIHLVKENIVISQDSRSSEKFMHGIKVLMAKNYIDNLSEETKKGMLEKARQGIWPSYAPLGYLNVMGADGKRTIAPNPDLAPIIQRMFERYATGQHSLKELAKLARQDGLQYPKSKLPVPTSTVHKILRNRIYSGDFDFDGKTYAGKYEAIVTRELWQEVQNRLDGRSRQKPRKGRREFAFSNLIRCGHCGCAMVGELKKQQYVYYHCSRYKGRCPEPYTREEVLEERFSELLRKLTFPKDVLEWIVTALRESHRDEKDFHDEAIARLQAEYRRLQDRIDAMYLDKLDGRIDNAFFDRKSAEWRAEQDRILRDIETHQSANRTYIEEGVQLLRLADRAHALFERQEPAEKRRLLNFLLSNCVWKDGALTAEYRQPFDMLALAREAAGDAVEEGAAKSGRFENWLGRSNKGSFGAQRNTPSN